MKNTLPPPLGWGDDGLTGFFDAVRTCQFWTFAKKKPETARIVGIDECFRRVLHGWTSPLEIVPVFLMQRAHSAYRVAASCAFAGQFAELHPLLRLMLEHGGYAIRINRKPELIEVWLNRHKSDTHRSKAISEFKNAKIKNALALCNENLEEIYSDLYEMTIDYGAHPNEMGILSSIRIDEGDNQKVYSASYLNTNEILLDFCLQNLAQVGVCVLLIFQEIFRERFDLLGASSELVELQKGL